MDLDFTQPSQGDTGKKEVNKEEAPAAAGSLGSDDQAASPKDSLELPADKITDNGDSPGKDSSFAPPPLAVPHPPASSAVAPAPPVPSGKAPQNTAAGAGNGSVESVTAKNEKKNDLFSEKSLKGGEKVKKNFGGGKTDEDLPVAKPAPKAAGKAPRSHGVLVTVVVLLIVAVLGGASYFLLGTSTGKGLIGLQDADKQLSNDGLGTDLGSGDSGFGKFSDSGGSDATQKAAALATSQERDAKRKEDLAKLKAYLDSYFADNQSYPLAPVIEKTRNSDSAIYKALIPKYAASFPDDPWADDYGYWYGYKSLDGKSYHLTARLEDTADPAGAMEGSLYIYRMKMGAPAEKAEPLSSSADQTGDSSLDSLIIDDGSGADSSDSGANSSSTDSLPAL